MVKNITCIMCPRGCSITAEVADGKICSAEGNFCPKGLEYLFQEVTAPMRNIASSVLVEGGEMPLASVRLSAPVPKERIFDVMEEIRKVKVRAPVVQGQVIIPGVLGLDCDVIATRNVEAEESAGK